MDINQPNSEKLTSTASASYQYDVGGNMVQKSEGKDFWRYTWDYENRLVESSTRKQKVRYKYDALGRRVQRYGNNENTKYIHEGEDVLIDDNSGTQTKYLNGLGIDNKLSSKTGTIVWGQACDSSIFLILCRRQEWRVLRKFIPNKQAVLGNFYDLSGLFSSAII